MEDMARGLMRCALFGEPSETYNLASGHETSILELATLINQATGNPIPPEIKPALRDWDRSGKRFGSTEKAAEKLGFIAKIGIEEGIEKLVKWTLENKSLIQSCIHRHSRQIELI